MKKTFARWAHTGKPLPPNEIRSAVLAVNGDIVMWILIWWILQPRLKCTPVIVRCYTHHRNNEESSKETQWKWSCCTIHNYRGITVKPMLSWWYAFTCHCEIWNSLSRLPIFLLGHKWNVKHENKAHLHQAHFQPADNIKALSFCRPFSKKKKKASLH